MEKFNFQNEVIDEKVRIYDDPSQDPIYQEFERRILENTNTDEELKKAEGTTSYSQKWNSVNFRKSLHHWSSFANLYPEKAKAYSNANPLIQRAILDSEPKIEESQIEQVQEESTEEPITKWEPSPMYNAYMEARDRLEEVNPDGFEKLMRFTSDEKDPLKIKEYADSQELTPEEKYFLDSTYHLRMEGK